MTKVCLSIFGFWLALLLPVAAQAQNDFRPGYLVPLAGDTLRGELNFQSDLRNARACRFRPTPAGTITTYGPGEARGYGFAGGKFYQSYSVATSRTAAATAAPRFLEVLVQGSVNLYYLSDATAGDLFYARTAQGAAQLLWSWQETVYDGKGGKFARENPEFRVVLEGMMVSCATMQLRTATAAYQSKSLVTLVRSYNQCVGGKQTLTPALANRKSRINLTAVAGAQTSTLEFSNNSIIGGTEGTGFRAGFAPVVGLAFEAHLSAPNNRLAVVLEALYAPQRSEGDYANTYLSNRYYGQVRVRLDYLRVPLLLRYSLTKGTVRPFLQAGVGTSFVLNGEQEYRFSNTLPPNIQYTPWRPIFIGAGDKGDYRRVENSVLFGFGVSTARPNARNLALEFRGERSNGFSLAPGISTIFTRYFLLLHYDLTK